MSRLSLALTLALGCMTFSPHEAGADPERRRSLGVFKVTYYWVAQERAGDGPRDREIFDPRGRSLGRFSERFVRALELEGSAMTLDGRVLNVAGKKGARRCFVAVEAPFGLGCRSNPLVPFRSLATDPKTVPYGTIVYIPEAVGARLPGGGAHDGYFIAADVGGGIKGRHFDVFTGHGDQRHVFTAHGLANLRRFEAFEVTGGADRPALTTPPSTTRGGDSRGKPASSTEPERSLGRGRVDTPSLNLRVAPQAGSLVLRRLASGMELEVLDRTGEWLEVVVVESSEEGFVQGRYVQLDAEPRAAEPTKKPPLAPTPKRPAKPQAKPEEGFGAAKAASGRRIPRSLRGLRALSSAKSSTHRRYEHYRKLAQAHGYRVATERGERTVIGLRAITPDGRGVAEQYRVVRRYNDSFIVLWRDERGRPRVETFRGGTVPGQTSTRASGTPDVDRDGRKDIAHLRPGRYQYRRGTFKGLSAYRPTTKTASYRDTNQDGRIDPGERRASIARGDMATGILFHRGLESRPSSVGCQTMAPEVFEAFERALGDDARFEYILVDPRAAQDTPRS